MKSEEFSPSSATISSPIFCAFYGKFFFFPPSPFCWKSRNQTDINECSRNNGRGECQDICRNTWGSFECSCENLPNTKLSSDGRTCEDAGDCANNNGNCSHICLFTMKKIFCLCPEGRELEDDEKTCRGNGILNLKNIIR